MRFSSFQDACPLFVSGVALLCVSGCVSVPQEPVPHITTTLLPAVVEKLPAPMQVSLEQKREPWGQEYLLGKEFARIGDYYRAATCFHRSIFLLPEKSVHYSEVFHALILTYSIAGKHDQVIALYERSRDRLDVHDPKLALDCIALIYEAYSHKDRLEEAGALFQIIPKTEETAKALPVFQALSLNCEDCFTQALAASADLSKDQKRDLAHLVKVYRKSKKHPETAATLNAILPGAGYLYVKEYQTAGTALLFNGLFIAAAWQLFSIHQAAAGFIAGGFEFGWYSGGIIGAHMAATTYNERLREQLVKYYLQKYQLYPLNRLNYQW